MPTSKHRRQLHPRITSHALAMRPASRRLYAIASLSGVVVATVMGGGIAYFGDLLWKSSPDQAGVWGAVGAFVAALMGVLSVPLARRVLITRTEVRLIDAASPLHPLLKRLMVEAPGTYTHSLATASLAEAAAEAVGADPLVARVGAYYHDIGKLKRPCYFFENLAEGDNPHDEAQPSLSALIISSHVTDGLDLATEYDLPPSVVSIIREHHGTSLIKYFFHKATSEDPGVAEADFRYHGGVPTSREAALVMLADSSEASVRALREPTPDSIEGEVRSVISDKIDDGQLESSGLSEHDIDVVAKTFTKMLVGMLHSRCEYPRLVSSPKGGSNADQHRQS